MKKLLSLVKSTGKVMLREEILSDFGEHLLSNSKKVIFDREIYF